MFSFAMLFGNVSYDLFIANRTNASDPKKGTESGLNHLFYTMIIISGLTNMLLLIYEKKYIKDFQYELWKKSLIIKTIVTILISPLLEVIISLSVKEEDQISSVAGPIRFSVMLLMTMGSPFLRFYREYFMTAPQDSYIK